MTSTRTIYRAEPSHEYLISDGTIAAQALLYTALGSGAAIAPVLRLATGYAAPGWIALFVGCCIGMAALTWRIRVQDELRLTVYEETTEDTPDDGPAERVWTQLTPYTIATGSPAISPRVLRAYGAVLHNKRIAGQGQRHSRDDMDRAMRACGHTWAHDDWNDMLNEMRRAGWVRDDGAATSAFWAAAGQPETHEVL